MHKTSLNSNNDMLAHRDSYIIAVPPVQPSRIRVRTTVVMSARNLGSKGSTVRVDPLTPQSPQACVGNRIEE